MITFIEWLLENTEPQSFTLSDKNIVPEWVYNIFVESYLKSTGKAWDMNTFLGRSRSWTFFGIPPESEHDPAAGFVSVRFQNSGLVKLTGVAGSTRAILTGLSLVDNLNKPVWGAVSDSIASMAEKRGFIVPPPETMKMMAMFIPNLSVNDSGDVQAHVIGVGDVNKKVIVNQKYMDWFKKQYPQIPIAAR